MKEETNNQITATNYSLMNNDTFVNLKLNTSPLLESLENYLGKKRIIYRDENDEIKEEIVISPYALANAEGIDRIIGIVMFIANNHSVQGNTKEFAYYEISSDIWKSVAEELINNCYEWEIKDQNLSAIIERIAQFFRLFLSRTIDNKERESLTSQFSSREIISQNEKQGLLQKFSGGFKE